MRGNTAAVIEDNARLAASKTAMGLSQFTGGLADLLAKIRGPQAEETKMADWAIPTAIAVIIPIIVHCSLNTVGTLLTLVAIL